MIDRFLRRIAVARGFLAKLWAIAKPYWFASDKQAINLLGLRFSLTEAWIARSLIALVIGLNIFLVFLNKLFNDWNGRFYNALQDKDAAAFRYEIGYFTVLALIFIIAGVYSQWFSQLLTIRWRRWLTNVYVRDWMENRTYYRMELTGDGTDNPEQRIEQDCSFFATQTLGIVTSLLAQIITLVTFTTILWNLSGGFILPLFGGLNIPGYMFWAALVYAIVGSVFTYWVGRPLVGINFLQQRYNADFRYRMTRVRENAESIALYRGEPDERRSLAAAFTRIYGNWWLYMKYNKRLNWLTSFYGQAAIIFPLIVAAPPYFAGTVQLGVIFQTASAFGQVQGALSWFVNSFADIADWMAVVDRLTTFGESMARAKAAQAAKDGITVAADSDDEIRLEDVDIRLPNGALLLEHVDLRVGRGETIALTGPSGSGKTTLFRALAGLWTFGRGVIRVPAGARPLFLPQKPYLPIGTLKQVLAYPDPPERYDDATCREVLEACALSPLAARLEEAGNWSLALSVGEQQRLAFARALLYRPDWIFIDEGSSALDVPTEQRMYLLLTQRLKGATILSIAHRPSVLAFHKRHVAITEERTVEEVAVQESAATG
jgi:vitamin B12/bleomycin/antimicrobial peptide transport system ATP-binding/permease protein